MDKNKKQILLKKILSRKVLQSLRTFSQRKNKFYKKSLFEYVKKNKNT